MYNDANEKDTELAIDSASTSSSSKSGANKESNQQNQNPPHQDQQNRLEDFQERKIIQNLSNQAP